MQHCPKGAIPKFYNYYATQVIYGSTQNAVVMMNCKD